MGLTIMIEVDLTVVKEKRGDEEASGEPLVVPILLDENENELEVEVHMDMDDEEVAEVTLGENVKEKKATESEWKVQDPRLELVELVHRKVEMMQNLACLEMQIHTMEGNYLASTATSGNVARGWQALRLELGKLDEGEQQVNTEEDFQRAKIALHRKFLEKERIFSRSSITSSATVKAVVASFSASAAPPPSGPLRRKRGRPGKVKKIGPT